MRRTILIASALVLFMAIAPAATATSRFYGVGDMHFGGSFHAATLLPDGRILIAGGQSELYNPSSRTFELAGSMTTPRAWGLTATLLPDGMVLITGGMDSGDTSTANAELYDPETGIFTPVGSMTAPRSFHTATLLPDGKVLITGGFRYGFPNSAQSSADIYDPVTSTFSATGSMAQLRSYHTATLLPDGKVLIAGGFLDHFAIQDAELYDPAVGTFAATGSMTLERAEHTATMLPNGKVLIAGGYALLPGAAHSSAELYDPAAGTFSPTADMTTWRAEHTATLLPDGKVLIAGGLTSYPWFGTPLATAEVYDPDAALFADTGSMAGARGRHAAAALVNGDVLVAGGIGACCGELNTAEVFSSVEPSDTTPPVVSIATPPEGGAYSLHEVVLADFACEDESGGSGVASCVGDLAVGDPIDTSSVGPKSFTVVATDIAGNSASLTYNYRVVYATTTITSTTKLTQDHLGAIVIAANRVTFDCAGHLITGSGTGNVILIDGYSGVTVKNCRITGGDYGLVVANSTGPNTLLNNSSFSNLSDGIYLQDADSTTLSGNKASNNGLHGFDVSGGSSQNKLRANSSMGNGGEGFVIQNGPSRNILEQNMARANVSNGFTVVGSDYNTLSMNRSEGNLRGYFLMGTTGTLLSGNTATENTEYGFEMLQFEMGQSSNATFRGNSAIQNGAGFRLASNENTLDKNLAKANGSPGFSLDGASGNLFTGNEASANAGVGFELLNGASGNTLLNNSSFSNLSDGIYLQDADMTTLIGNEARDNGSNGFDLVSSSHVTLRGNTSAGNSGRGFLVTDSSSDTLLHNSADLNGGSGFTVMDSSGNTLEANTSRANGERGVELSNADNNLLTANTAVNNAWDGFSLRSDSSDNRLAGNTSNLNNWGFELVDSQRNVYLGNTAIRNDYDGFYVENANENQLTDNTANGNSSSGFYLLSGSTRNLLTYNTANGNGDVGFLLDASPGNTLRGNMANNNRITGIEVKSSSDNNRIEANMVSGSVGDGIRITDSNSNLIHANTSNRNGGIGFHVMLGSVGNTLKRNVGLRNVVFDASDENGAGVNTWKANLFGTTQFA